MTRDIIEINNFVVLIEESTAEKTIVEKCDFGDPVIGFSFYGSGDVKLSIGHGNKKRTFHHTKGFAMSFFANDQVEFEHSISHDKPLQCICIFSTVKNLDKLPEQESEIFTKYLNKLIHPTEDFVEGPNFYMAHDMQNAVDKIFNTTYKGTPRMMFLRSQITELLSHFFALISSNTDNNANAIKKEDREKLYHAKEILSQSIDTPPSLHELSKLIGLNNYKLKKNFKELFGVPVYKYLQNERLNKAYELLNTGDTSIREAAWAVGYESLSSFSSAFLKKFGFRPSEIKK
ncbi:helix-turn-helix domain-containing protein [Aquimarina sediminis]|uniref:helix-turn-helix domain-containing protein n=1 Tax=Aquimarina sediminis TaxID=2070536 RepID=UPI000CA03E47|nr:AraC family transcriptional regulator [Aquimarina sediminis]